MATTELRAVFNFYETITPPPGVADFVDGWKSLGSYVETLDHYIGAQLHRNIDPKGKFPYANFSTFTGSYDRIINDFMNPDRKLIEAVVKGHGMPGIQVNHPGGYDEIKTLDGELILPDLPPKFDSLFVLSAFMGCMSETDISNCSKLEDAWSEWAGINALKAALPAGVTIGQTGLYKRFTPGEPYKAVTYVVRCQIRGLKHDLESSPVGSEFLAVLRSVGAPKGLRLVDSSLYRIDEHAVSLPASH